MQPDSSLHALVQKIAASRQGSWLFARVARPLDKLIFKLSSGQSNVTTTMTGLPVAEVTTVGAKSGLPRTLPLVYIPDRYSPNAFALVASNFGKNHNPAWYYNLKAHPCATCVIDGKSGEYIAHEVYGEEYEQYWQSAVEIYAGYMQYKRRTTRKHIPIMVMTPVS